MQLYHWTFGFIVMKASDLQVTGFYTEANSLDRAEDVG